MTTPPVMDAAVLDFSALAGVPGLQVITGTLSIAQAVRARAFTANYCLDDHDPAAAASAASDAVELPLAVLVADSVAAVQAAVQFCAARRNQNQPLHLSVRSGGHSWQSIWLGTSSSPQQQQGAAAVTVLLDVGGMNRVEPYDAATQTVAVGPGATDINRQIPDHVFLPMGHCRGVPAGGFILAGGYGTGFCQYGMTSTLVEAVEVVLASGQVRMVRAEDTTVATAVAIMALLRGSYHRFPAVVTKYVLRTVPTPQCVLAPAYTFALRDWRTALKLARDIHHRNDDDTVAAMMETTIILGHASDAVQAATGETRVTTLAFLVWSDRSEQETRVLVREQLTDRVLGTTTAATLLVPPVSPLESLNAKTISDLFVDSYPPHKRYLTEGWLGDERLFDAPDDVYEAMLQPLVELWSRETAPPAPSHTIFPLCHPTQLRQRHGDRDLACGCNPSFNALSYVIYDNAARDDEYRTMLHAAQSGFLQTDGVWTQVGEGRIRHPSKPIACSDRAEAVLNQHVALLDPHGLFAKEG